MAKNTTTRLSLQDAAARVAAFNALMRTKVNNPLTGSLYQKFPRGAAGNRELVLSIYPDAECVKTNQAINSNWKIKVGDVVLSASTSSAASAWYEAARYSLPGQIRPSTEKPCPYHGTNPKLKARCMH